MRLFKDTLETMASITANIVKRAVDELAADLTDDELDIFYKDMEAFLGRLNMWRELVRNRKEDALEDALDHGVFQ